MSCGYTTLHDECSNRSQKKPNLVYFQAKVSSPGGTGNYSGLWCTYRWQGFFSLKCTQQCSWSRFKMYLNADSPQWKKGGEQAHVHRFKVSPLQRGWCLPIVFLNNRFLWDSGSRPWTQRRPNVWLNWASPPFRLTSLMGLWCSEHTTDPKDPEKRGDNRQTVCWFCHPFPNNSLLFQGRIAVSGGIPGQTD